MRVLRVCLLLLTAAILHPASLHAATRSTTTHRFVPAPATFHHADAPSLRHRFTSKLPAETLPSSVNTGSASSSFSLIAYAIHSVLGLFTHSPS